MPQKYENEKSPILNGKKAQNVRKILKMRDLEGPTLHRPFANTLYIDSGLIFADHHEPDVRRHRRRAGRHGRGAESGGQRAGRRGGAAGAAARAADGHPLQEPGGGRDQLLRPRPHRRRQAHPPEDLQTLLRHGRAARGQASRGRGCGGD